MKDELDQGQYKKLGIRNTTEWLKFRIILRLLCSSNKNLGALTLTYKPATHKPTMQQFDPHYPSTQWTVCYDNALLWHSDTYTIRPGIFCPSWLRAGQFVTCDMTSTLLKTLCDIMSTLSWSEIWTVCHMISGLIWDVLPAGWRNVDILSQDFFQHVCNVQPAIQQNLDFFLHDFGTCLWCPAACSAKCGHFVTGFFWHICVCVCVPVHHPWISVPCALT